jgi:hypothetical protein
MNLDEHLAQLEAHEAAIRKNTDATQATPNHDDDGSGLHKDINAVFSRVEQAQRLDRGRKRLVIKSYAA